MWVCLICAGGCNFHLSITTIINFQFIPSVGSDQQPHPHHQKYNLKCCDGGGEGVYSEDCQVTEQSLTELKSSQC